MGIRVHKMLGYGLTDVAVAEDGYTIADDRINTSSILLNYDRDIEANTDAYFAFAKEQGILMSSREAFGGKVPDKDPFNAVVYEGEYGLPNVLCVQPVGVSNWGWWRFDDAIDYVEESVNHDQQNRVQVLEHGIFPFDGYMNAETGEGIKQEIYIWIRANGYGVDDLGMLDLLAQRIGFKDHEEAKRLVVPVVPEEVRTLARFGQLFTSDDVWKQLRPMLYVYWA